jgi:hypothetical protein
MKLVQTVGDRRIVTALTAVAALALCAAGAIQAGTARTSSFCSVSKGVGKDLSNIQKDLQSAPTPTRLKAEYSAILAAEPSLKSSVPGNLKTQLNTVLTLANQIASSLKAANWSIVALLPHASTLSVQFAKAKPSLNALDAYWKGTCHLKV